jgi:citrate lyase subunit beta/citryl-CoA lyase
VPYPLRVSYARSWLYVPGNRRDFLGSALSRGADALVLDLEDSVPASGKEAARAAIAAWLPDRPPTAAELWLRVNGNAAAADLRVVTAAVAGVLVPKAEPRLLAEVDELLGQRERELRLPAGTFAVVPLIETARGLLAAERLAGMPRAAHLGLGEADLCAELRLHPSDTGEEMAPLRMQVVLASAAAGIGAPIAPTSRDFRDLEALRASTEALLRGGFRARTAIHPAQVPVINEVFSPSAAQVAEARRLVEAFERSPSGVMSDVGGRMVDVAVVRSARELLARAGRGAAR